MTDGASAPRADAGAADASRLRLRAKTRGGTVRGKPAGRNGTMIQFAC